MPRTPAGGIRIRDEEEPTLKQNIDVVSHLERLGIRHIAIAGMTADHCCEATGRHAVEHGDDVTFLTDAIGAENMPAYDASRSMQSSYERGAVFVNVPKLVIGKMPWNEPPTLTERQPKSGPATVS